MDLWLVVLQCESYIDKDHYFAIKITTVRDITAMQKILVHK